MASQDSDDTRHNVVNDASASTIGTLVQVGTLTGEMHLHQNPAGPGFIAPRELPAPPALVTGRHAELAGLTQALHDGPADTVVISAASGTGGTGKTSPVLHWAYRHLDRFPDRQLYVDLRGFSPDSKPIPSSIALRGFLCALGVAPAAIPVDDHPQAAVFRSVTTGKRMLIVLDNAASTDQIKPLLPGSPTCTALVTSRCRLTGLIDTHGARYLALDVLSHRDSLGVARCEDRDNEADS